MKRSKNLQKYINLREKLDKKGYCDDGSDDKILNKIDDAWLLLTDEEVNFLNNNKVKEEIIYATCQSEYEEDNCKAVRIRHIFSLGFYMSIVSVEIITKKGRKTRVEVVVGYKDIDGFVDLYESCKSEEEAIKKALEFLLNE